MRGAIRLGIAIVLFLTVSLALRAGTQIGTHAAMPVAGPASHTFPPGSAQLYWLSVDGAALHRLDAASLTDRAPPLRTGLRASATQNAGIIPSADGSRFVVVDQLPHQPWPASGRGFTLQLFDTATGRPLSAIHHPAVPLGAMGISTDGSIVYGFRVGDVNVACGPTDFYQLVTRTGHVIRHLTVGAAPWNAMLVDPGVRYLYTLTSPDAEGGCNPHGARHPTLTEYDLRIDKVVRSVQLRGILAGRWYTGRSVNHSPVVAEWTPGIALSPDGSQLAILDGHSNTLALLATPSLRLEGTESISRPKTGLAALAAALGLAPDAAEAKGQSVGVNLQIEYTADSRSLVVTGSRFQPDRSHPVGRAVDLGMRLVAVASGQVRARLQDGARIAGVWPAPDGSAVYSEVQGWTKRTGWFATVRRHDAGSLRLQASRTFTHTSWMSVVFLRAHHTGSTVH